MADCGLPHTAAWFTPQRATASWGRDLILRKVERETGITIAEMKGKRRTRGIAYARHEAMYLLRTNTTMSLPAIGRIFGNRHHASVLHGVREHAKRNGLEVPR